MTKASRGLIVVKKKSQKSALKPAENSQTKQDLTQNSKPNLKAENSQPKTTKNSQPKAVKNPQTKSRDLQNSRQAQPEMATSNKGYTMTRRLEIANFRNLGIGKVENLELNADATKGDLLILIGENNSGKSNVLRALQAFGRDDGKITDDDKPNFIGNDKNPNLRLVYRELCPKNSATSQQDEYGFIELTYSEQKSEIIDEQKTIEAFKGKIEELREFIEDESDLNELQEELESFSSPLYRTKLEVWYEKLKGVLFEKIEWVRYSAYYSSNSVYYECRKNINLLDEQFEYFDDDDMDLANKQKEFDSLRKKWQKLKDELESNGSRLEQSHINELQEHYTKLQELFFPQNEFDELLRYEHAEITDKMPKDFKKKFGIKPCPQVIFYNEKRLKDDDLSVKPENLENSSFFPSLFEVLGDNGKWLEIINEHYDSQKSFQRRELIKNINKRLKDTVSKRFNELYYNSDKDEIYGFELGLEDGKIEFYLYKNDISQKLSQQSEGFKWFFNFFFNFLHAQSLEKGDIVLIDEFGANLSIPAQRDLRDFLKDYAKQNALTFIISTHSPFLADMDFLDELRIIRQKGDGSSEIKNSFSLLDEGETDALREIKQAFGVQHFWGLKRFVFVEGITDYNYLTKFKRLYEAEKGLKRGEGLNFAFLPVNGLGKFEDGEETLTKKQEQLIEQLPKIAKANKDNCAILLVDNDKAGQAIKKAVKARENRDLVVITLDDAFDENAHIGVIESLFSAKDERNLGGKGTLPSQNFKNNHEPDKESKERFYRLLEYLNGYTEADE